MQFWLPIVLVALTLGYSFWMRRRAARALADARPAYDSFFRRTGYRHSDMPDAPPEAQAERSFRDASTPRNGGISGLCYVRDYHGLQVRYSYEAGQRREGGKLVSWFTNQWEADLPSPPRVSLHIADKSLDSALKVAKETFGQQSRPFEPKCSERVRTGVSAIDSKFLVFSDDPDAARALLGQNPALVQMLSGWAELDVSLTGGRLRFEDPQQRNMTAAMGGMIGSMALGFDYGKRLELAIPVHDRVADLFLALTRAAA